MRAPQILPSCSTKTANPAKSIFTTFSCWSGRLVGFRHAVVHFACGRLLFDICGFLRLFLHACPLLSALAHRFCELTLRPVVWFVAGHPGIMAQVRIESDSEDVSLRADFCARCQWREFPAAGNLAANFFLFFAQTRKFCPETTIFRRSAGNQAGNCGKNFFKRNDLRNLQPMFRPKDIGEQGISRENTVPNWYQSLSRVPNARAAFCSEALIRSSWRETPWSPSCPLW